MVMKKRFFLFSLILFFAAFCTSILVQKEQNNKLSHDQSLKNHFLQKSDNTEQTDLYSWSDQDDTDSNTIEKVKFDYSILSQKWLSCLFAQSFIYTPIAVIQNRIYLSAPRYILYQSLQIAGC
ncbi:hypothetical protein M2254_002566 [Chryseobacterium sp. BIGb0186]|nr:hypothetical protein [Chryseobacterium sp. BIGb0186]VXB79784.1 conserved exported hypothetical protein [Chryseobacterium sp. 8AT]